jgi:hypothetical protein
MPRAVRSMKQARMLEFKTGVPLDRVVTAALAFVYWLIILAIYRSLIAPRYAYTDMGWSSPNIVPLAINAILVVLLSFALPKFIEKPSDYILWLLYLTVIVGTSIVPIASGRLDDNQAVGLCLISSAALLTLRLLTLRGQRGDLKPVRKAQISAGSYRILTLILTTCVSGYVFYEVGFSLLLPNLNDVYALRLDFRNALAGLPALVGYAIPIASNVLIPLLLVLGIERRRLISMVLPAVIFQLALFGVDGQRLVLVTPLLVVALYVVYRRRERMHALFFLLGFALLSLVAAIVTGVTGNLLPLELFVRRVVLIPGQLVGGYFDYFQDHGYSYLQHSQIANWSGSLTEAPSYLIGDYMFGSSVQNANVNFIGDGYANFGYFGVFLFAIITGLVLKVLDIVSADIPSRIAVSVVASTGLVLANTSVLTALITNGILVLIALLLLLPGREFARAREEGEGLLRFVDLQRPGTSARVRQGGAGPRDAQLNPALPSSSSPPTTVSG